MGPGVHETHCVCCLDVVTRLWIQYCANPLCMHANLHCISPQQFFAEKFCCMSFPMPLLNFSFWKYDAHL